MVKGRRCLFKMKVKLKYFQSQKLECQIKFLSRKIDLNLITNMYVLRRKHVFPHFIPILMVDIILTINIVYFTRTSHFKYIKSIMFTATRQKGLQMPKNE